MQRFLRAMCIAFIVGYSLVVVVAGSLAMIRVADFMDSVNESIHKIQESSK